MIFDCKSAATRYATVSGVCALCSKRMWESLAVLDDAYAVWAGKCPHCSAINLLTTKQGRGYSSSQMWLVLPTEDEKEKNQMPADCPTQENPKVGA